MLRNTYLLFYAGVLVALNLFNGDDIPMAWQLGVALSAIFLIGIPHGAIDHIIYIHLQKTTQFAFYAPYLLLLAASIGLWIWQPALGFALFVLLSAYHFGQSQFYYLPKRLGRLKTLLYGAWGLSLLIGLLVYRRQEVIDRYLAPTELQAVIPYLSWEVLLGLLVGTIVLTLVTLVILTRYRLLQPQQLFSELFVFALLHLSFYLLPALISFTLYFVLIHSLGTIQEEVGFLRQLYAKVGLKRLAISFLPLTLISLFGIIGLLTLSHFSLLPYSIPFILFALIAGLTLPHSLVMTLFYRNRGGQ